MSCGCSNPFGNNSTPWSGDPWAIPNPNAQVPVGGIWGQPASTALVEVVFDPTTNQMRPLRPGEQSPGTDCGTCMKIDALAPPSKQLVQMYWDLFRRVKNLEQKYCNCICGPSTPVPTPPPAVDLHITGVQFNQETRDLLITRNDGTTYTQNIPGGGEFTQVPDQWRSDVIPVAISGNDSEPPAPITFSTTVASYPCFAVNGPDKVLPADAQSTGSITFSGEVGQPFWDYNGYPYGSYLFDYNNSGVYIDAYPESEEDFNSLTSAVRNEECVEVPTPVSPPPATTRMLCHGPQLVRHTTNSDGSTTYEEVEALSESCGYIPPYVREVPLRLFSHAKDRITIDGPQGPQPYYPWLDVGTTTARIVYNRNRTYPSNPVPPNTYQTNAPVQAKSNFYIEVVGTLPTLEPAVYRIGEFSSWSIYGLNFGGLFTDYDTIRRGGGERIIIDEEIMGQTDSPPENHLVLDSAGTTGADFNTYIENTARTPEELNDIVIGIINQINSVVFTI